jgi:hypothetical protein
MANFPRGTKAKPRLVSGFSYPAALQSWGLSGKGQFRSVMNMGREWTETYPVLNTSLATVRALLTALSQSVREGTVWQVQHPYLQTRTGAGGGTPLVKGASQTGSSLLVDGASNTVTGWLKAGDLMAVAGCAVVFDVTADCNSDGSGNVTVPINPPIFAGQSPADNAPVTILGSSIYFNAVISAMSDMPEIDVTGYLSAGLQVTFREQPQ